MSENILIVRAKGYLNKEAFEGMRELIREQVDVPFIIIDESVEDLDVLYGLNDKGEPLLDPIRCHTGTHVKLSDSIEFVHAPADGKLREGHAVHGPSVDMEFYKDRLVLRCIETIRSKLIYGESIEQAFDNPIYVYDLNEDEKRFVERYFRTSPLAMSVQDSVSTDKDKL
ncbi:hypothetical protein ICR95_22180 [Priestia megaterium]|uniref:hypothetical protein n=1 Tax=Priestia megaterium TaxID=1404 RepID=UPI00196A61E7|nr:hypothetical protein [Priestia megaterium]QSF32746.1 hypothetical protein ICR95_22180 [Priestia megaterium]